MRRNGICLAAFGVAAAMLVGTLGATPALAYFTDSASAKGGVEISVKPETTIVEEYGDKTKHVKILNKETSGVPVFARARVFANPAYLDTVGGTGWTGPEADGWYYFNTAIEPGQESDELLVKIVFPGGKKIIDEDGKVIQEIDREGENLNIIVVYEATPVQFNEDGTMVKPQDADWSLKAE